ncbi:proline iminopeptidase [Heyndrickxia shackletonii]|uniref:Proline iminopeptidase n=1 Tax=Heyndrickxia shackletonii TaxID=157838 RepID=A0A0Q3TF37_9BACI|nr:proline iminopeptidase-family hydrolase [Heyndrickxia shackletonii]KQL52662.1 proline iminopeptidase [Heyndrickxia shackletonii]NEZ01919.1 proline iminopeptidase-family hydrolase [Heyndrickxia shackletonii]
MTEGYVSVTGGKVYYKKVGNGEKTPVILLHGGPGGTHVPFFKLEELGDERPVIFYDQLGSGRSDKPDDLSLWHVERFVEELGQIREALGLSQLHILGHSWGTMLAASYLLTKPEGVKSVIFSSPCLSAPEWERDQEVHLKQLPQDVQDILAKHERVGTTDSEEYKTAMKEFNKRFVYRLESKPKETETEYAKSNAVVYNTMWGPSEFCTTGNLKSFDVTDRLKEIQIPALFTCGRFDEATPSTVEAQSRKLPGARFHVYENSAHLAYLEEPEEYIRVVREFLASAD